MPVGAATVVAAFVVDVVLVDEVEVFFVVDEVLVDEVVVFLVLVVVAAPVSTTHCE